MIYSNIRVELPKISGYIQPRGGVRYFYAYEGERRRDSRGRSVHPAAHMIGRVVATDGGADMLIPNDGYYRIMGQMPPKWAIAEGPGRKKSADEAARGSARGGQGPGDGVEHASALALAAKALLPCDSGKIPFGETFDDPDGTAGAILALAAYLCSGPRASLAGLGAFSRARAPFAGPSLVSAKGIKDLLSRLHGRFRMLLSRSLAQALGRIGKPVLYDLASFETPEGGRTPWPGALTWQGSPVQEDAALLCASGGAAPLAICALKGSLLDPKNLDNALDLAIECDIKASRKSLTIVTDSLMRDGKPCCAHLMNRRIISRLGWGAVPEADRMFMDWASKIGNKEYARGFLLDGMVFGSCRADFELGDLKGCVVMYQSLLVHTQKLMALTERRDCLAARLETRKRVPNEGFDFWASSFSPLIKVRLAQNGCGFEWEQDNEAFNEEYLPSGGLMLFTTCADATDEEILRIYLQKPRLEESYAAMCGTMAAGGDPLGKQPQGRLFAALAALSLKCAINARTQKWQEKCKCCAGDAIEALDRIMFAREGGRWSAEGELEPQDPDLLRSLGLI